ncbi:MAG: hypothetical protein AAFR04_09655 [Pseudomonadota bacterium]
MRHTGNRYATGMGLALAAGATVVLTACTYERNGLVGQHFNDFQTRAPYRNTVHVCRAYGCRVQTKFKFTRDDIRAIRRLMRRTAKNRSAFQERRAIAYAIGWMERRVGKALGTSVDRPGMDLAGSGDPSQHDCVDEATNSTSYLLVLQSNGLLKHHTVGTPFSKGNILMGIRKWPHWGAVLWERGKGRKRGKPGGRVKYVVDSWPGPNGENPAIVRASKWYLADLDNLPKALR